uniref:Uncharacterized protein n=1 Tax=viral metagenome TaxID=1070528 RepID=A0A6C0D9T1_9ZZZZ
MNTQDIINKFGEFITHVNQICPDNTVLANISNESDDQKLNRISKFNTSISSTTNLNYFIKNKIKLFSHKEKDTLKISSSLFGTEMSLKKIFNNQEETIKLILWKDLQSLLLVYNKYLLSSDPNNKQLLDRVEKLSTIDQSSFNNVVNPKESLNKILNTDNLNDQTNEMINDIFGSFEKTLSTPNSNPFGNIMEISQIITEKYKDKIEQGDINLDDLLKNMTQLPGMENVGNMVGMLSKQLGGAKAEDTSEKVIIDENFSTSIVPQGEQTKEPESSMNVTSLLKTMDSLGVIGNSQGMPDMGNLMGMMGGEGGPDMNKLMGLFNKLGQTNDSNELNNLFEKELGIDMNKFNDELSKTFEKN